ncbi:alpha/beta hydrolase family protein [Paenibacillus hamazuiensis]|uniref:alpha/beta hydrolase family protein n=1 Tax=Paenibacillus hamazuiensis TaxID=2936508 RepID=UPI00200D0228|nr:alpha/beta hydrolase family protein [Paenibacillus hamazuiensis]
MSFNTDLFLQNLYVEAERSRSFNQAAAGSAKQLRETLKSRLMQALGGFPEQKAPLNPVLLDTQDYGDFVLERVQYTTMDQVLVPVYVLKPKTGEGPWPAVLACHGHGKGQRDALGMAPDGTLPDEPGIHSRFAVELVRRGLLVVVPEIMGFGARRLAADIEADPDGGRSSCAVLSAHLIMYGKTLAGIRVYEAMRALDYLQSREDADATRIGTFGFSGGGLIGGFTAALDERIRATVICGYTNTFQGSILAMNHCIDNYLPGILPYAEQPDLLGLIAPRDLFVESGEGDRIFPVRHVHAAIDRLKEIYAEMNAESHFAADLFPGKHQISGRQSFDWLAGRLKAL